jgi:hypothetical protein
VDEIRVERDALDERVKQLSREGLSISSIVEAVKGDPAQGYIVRVNRRFEIRDDK